MAARPHRKPHKAHASHPAYQKRHLLIASPHDGLDDGTETRQNPVPIHTADAIDGRGEALFLVTLESALE